MPRLTSIMLFAGLVAGAAPLSAQQERRADRERWQVTLDGDHYVWDIRLVRLDGDALVIRQSDSLARLPVDHITEVRLIHASTMDLGTNGAGAMNALTGGDDEIYDLTTMELADRVRAIKKILADHPPER